MSQLLEVAVPHSSRGPGRLGRLGVKLWAAAWPKLLAIALVLAFWQLVHVSGWKKLVLPGPGPVIANLWDQLHTSLLWRAVGTTTERALIGFALAILIGTV